MRDLQDRLPDLLHDLAGEMPADPNGLERRTLRRARVRRAVAASASTLLVAAVIAGVVLGVRELGGDTAAVTPGQEPSPEVPTPVETPAFPGIWPSSTPEQLAEIQASVDEGHQPWQLDAAMTAEAFAVNVLGWEPEAVESSVESETADQAVVAAWHRDRSSIVTRVVLAKLGETGPTGVWTVVRADEVSLLRIDGIGFVDGGATLRVAVAVQGADEGRRAILEISDASAEVAEVAAEVQSIDPGPAPIVFEAPVASSDGSLTIVLLAIDREGVRLAAEAFAIAVPVSAMPSPSIDLADLPPDVAVTAQRIHDGVLTHDIAGLARLIDPDTFVFDFDDGSDPTPAWRADPSVLDPILAILELPYTVEVVEGYGTFYVWPYLAADGSLEEITDRERADLRALGFTDEHIQEMVAFGGYLGPRLAIDEQGRWRNYVTGGD